MSLAEQHESGPVEGRRVELRFFDVIGASGPGVDCAGGSGFEVAIFDDGEADSSVYHVSVENVDALETIINAAGAGGCLGYGVIAGCTSDPISVEAFHIEIDTYYNSTGGGHPMQDPVDVPHIAVTLNGNPDNHVLHVATPTIEDNLWHDLKVEIEGIHIKLTLDELVIFEDDVAGIDFRGGYIGFSGTTGALHNFHSFDNLHVIQGCVVP